MSSRSPLLDCVVVIPAGGTGSRMHESTPKQFLDLHGLPIIIRTIQTAANVAGVSQVVVATLPASTLYLQELLVTHNLAHCTAVVEGGTDRASSVANALRHPAVKHANIILVHDAVRPFASAALYERVIAAAAEYGCAVPALPVTDTIKMVDSAGFVTRTPNRAELRAVQTPQAFRRELLIASYESRLRDDLQVTDDASLCERNGIRVVTVLGETWNVKLTQPEDLLWAQTFIKSQAT
jgi:2-C-methyl-D-erythritol 4-phosphate cytidylyltransferase